jgi:glycosyltransferase involved in cell wall biosynthesis
MKILVSSLPDLKKIPPQRPHHLLKHLSEKHEVTVIMVNARQLREMEDEYSQSCIANLQIHYLSEGRRNPVVQELSPLWRSGFYKNLGLDRFDVHINLYSLLLGYFTTKRMKSLGIPTVFDICDDLPQRASTSSEVPRALRCLGRLVGESLMRKNIQLSERITFTTRVLGESYEFPIEKSVLVPNGVDTELFYERDSRTLREQLGVSDCFVLGFVGVLSRWDNLELAFACLKDLHNSDFRVRLLIVGGGETLEMNRRLAERYDVLADVLFIGHVPYSQVPEYISCMDCCILPIKTSKDCQNASPLTLLEYMACGKPVVSTPLAGIEEVVDGRIRYASSVEELNKTILELSENRERLENIGRSGREFVEQNLSWKKICKIYDDLLEEITDGSACE